jgi:hypothetical protein
VKVREGFARREIVSYGLAKEYRHTAARLMDKRLNRRVRFSNLSEVLP